MPTVTLVRKVPPAGTNRPQAYSYISQLLSSVPSEDVVPPLIDILSYISSKSYWARVFDIDSLLKYVTGLEISIANPGPIRDYLARHEDLPPVVWEIASEVRHTFPDIPSTLELVHDPEDVEAETLVLYLQPHPVESSLFQHLRNWNRKIAERMASSQAWFLVDLDLRKRA